MRFARAIASGRRRSGQPFPRYDSPEAYRRVGELLPQLAALLREQIVELEMLEAPTELESASRENLDRLTRSVELLDQGSEAAAAQRSRPLRRCGDRGSDDRA
jgi:hypothetical protein